MSGKRNYPQWFDGKKINEILFCESFRKEHPMICVNGKFFTVDGAIEDEQELARDIFDAIKFFVTEKVSSTVKSLMEVLKLMCYSAPLPLQTDRIHVANGTCFLDGRYSYKKEFCLNRLKVAYNEDAPRPDRFLAFLEELLYPEDIPTLQEFMGYCLIPSTKGQKMLILTGRGGEGKSRIGLVLRALLGSNMNTGSIAKIETSPFARADLEHQLVMLDDDMKLEALPQTNNIKAIVTAELPMDLERKGRQSYQGDLYVRFLALGNGTLQSLYDRSVGFFRRQIILTVKEKDPNRRDDPYLAEKLCSEAEGIFLWALEGLHRLIDNDYRFTISEAAKENMTAAVSEGNNIVEFLNSEGYIRFKADFEASSRELYSVYRLWCEDNAATPLSAKSFCSYLKQNERTYNLEYTNKVHVGNGRFVRGFMGIEVLHRGYEIL